ncbi:hypothetical protein BDV26DRAFT_271563, partial [Aspergillus bertholletiae]
MYFKPDKHGHVGRASPRRSSPETVSKDSRVLFGKWWWWKEWTLSSGVRKSKRQV